MYENYNGYNEYGEYVGNLSEEERLYKAQLKEEERAYKAQMDGKIAEMMPDGSIRYRNPRKPGKQEVINWFKETMGGYELDLVDDTFDDVARHVCVGGASIEILPKQVYMLPTEVGEIQLEYYQCLKCGKVILNRNFM